MTKTIGYIGTPFLSKEKDAFDVWVITNAGKTHPVCDQQGEPILTEDGNPILFPDPPEGNHYFTTKEVAESIVPNSKVEIDAEPDSLIEDTKKITYLNIYKKRQR